MISSNQEEYETFYSPYGYVTVNKSEYNSPSTIIKFTKENTFSGSINVNAYFNI